eukprot:7112054-Pyramimonas_sp.AAC.1
MFVPVGLIFCPARAQRSDECRGPRCSRSHMGAPPSRPACPDLTRLLSAQDRERAAPATCPP